MKISCPQPVSLVAGCLAMVTALLAGHVHAETPVQQDAVYDMQLQIGADGLAVQQPVISQQEILATLNQAHRLLSAKERAALKVIDESNPKGDLVVAAIMPGGLIYLAIQKQKLDTAKQQLSSIEMELDGLDQDAVTLYEPTLSEPVQQPITVARFP